MASMGLTDVDVGEDDSVLLTQTEILAKNGLLCHNLGARCLLQIHDPGLLSSTSSFIQLNDLILRYGSTTGGEEASRPHALRLAEDLRRASVDNPSHNGAQILILRGPSRCGKSETLKQIAAYYCNRENLSSLIEDRCLSRDSSRPLGTFRNPFPFSNDSSQAARRLVASLSLLQYFGQLRSTEGTLSSPCLMQHIALRFSTSSGKLIGSRVQALFPEQLTLTRECPLIIQCLVSMHSGQQSQLHSTVREKYRTICEAHELLLGDAHKELDHLHRMLVDLGELPLQQYQEFLQVVMAVMHLQQLVILGSETATLSSASKPLISQTEELLAVESNSLMNSLFKRPDDRIGRPPGAMIDAKPAEARQAVELLCRTLLANALCSLLDRLACSDLPSFDFSENVFQERGFVHVFDPIGWETMESAASSNASSKSSSTVNTALTASAASSTSSLPQLCKHFLEDHLSELFVDKALRDEIHRFGLEGVQLQSPNIPDWAPSLKIWDDSTTISGSNQAQGVFALLEDVANAPRGEDRQFVDRLKTSLPANVMRLVPSLNKSAGRNSAGSFALTHSFGECAYDADNLVQQQRQSILSTSVLMALRSSASALVVVCATSGLAASAPNRLNVEKKSGPGNTSREREKDVGVYQRLREGCRKLMLYLRSCPAHWFILCSSRGKLRPEPLALRGLVDIVQQGYVYIKPYHAFYNAFRLLLSFDHDLLPMTVEDYVDVEDARILCQQLLQECVQLPVIQQSLSSALQIGSRSIPFATTIAFGHTVIMMKEKTANVLDSLRRRICDRKLAATMSLQRNLRMAVHRRAYTLLRRAIVAMQTHYRMRTCHEEYTQLRKAAIRVKGLLRTFTLSKRWKAIRVAVRTLQTHFLALVSQRIRYRQYSRGLHALHGLIRGASIRRKAQNVFQSLLLLQRSVKAFLTRLRRFRIESAASIRIQRHWRGAFARKFNFSTLRIVQILAVRRKQRIAQRIVRKLQSLWRGKLVSMRFQEIVQACVALQRWIQSRNVRHQFLTKKRVAIWVQSHVRRKLATKLSHALRVKQLLGDEQRVLNECFHDETRCLKSQLLGDCLLGSDYYLHGKRRFDRILVSMDLFFDISLCYPDGWLQAMFGVVQRCINARKCVSHIAIGAHHTVLVDDHATVYTFGMGDCGQLGHSNRASLTTPRAIESMTKILAAAEDKKNKSKSGGESYSASLGTSSLSPKVSIQQVVCGQDHTLLLTTTGRLFSWGDNRRGQLGHSMFDTLSTPRLIHSLSLKKIVSIAAGAHFSMCLTEPGVLYTWGSGECIGRDLALEIKQSLNPQYINTNVTPTSAQQQLQQHLLQLQQQQTMSGKWINRYDAIRDCVDCSEPQTPLFFARRKVQAMTAGESHTTVLSMGEVLAWGSNIYGQLGIGSSNISLSKVPLKVSFEKPFAEKELLNAKISTGGRHVALLCKGNLWMWGWNKFGQIGDGDTGICWAPKRITVDSVSLLPHSAGTTLTTGNVQAIALTWRSSVALTVDYSLFGWGVINPVSTMTRDGVSCCPDFNRAAEFDPMNPSQHNESEEPSPIHQRDPFSVFLSPYRLPMTNQQSASLLGKHTLSLFANSSNSLSMVCIEVETLHAYLTTAASQTQLQSRAYDGVQRADMSLSLETLNEREIAKELALENQRALERAAKRALLKRDVLLQSDRDRKRELALETLRKQSKAPRSRVTDQVRVKVVQDEVSDRLRSELGNLSVRKLTRIGAEPITEDENSPIGSKESTTKIVGSASRKISFASTSHQALPPQSLKTQAVYQLQENSLKDLFESTQFSKIKNQRWDAQRRTTTKGSASSSLPSPTRRNAVEYAQSQQEAQPSPGQHHVRPSRQSALHLMTSADSSMLSSKQLSMSPLLQSPAGAALLDASPQRIQRSAGKDKQFLQSFLQREATVPLTPRSPSTKEMPPSNNGDNGGKSFVSPISGVSNTSRRITARTTTPTIPQHRTPGQQSPSALSMSPSSRLFGSNSRPSTPRSHSRSKSRERSTSLQQQQQQQQHPQQQSQQLQVEGTAKRRGSRNSLSSSMMLGESLSFRAQMQELGLLRRGVSSAALASDPTNANPVAEALFSSGVTGAERGRFDKNESRGVATNDDDAKESGPLQSLTKLKRELEMMKSWR